MSNPGDGRASASQERFRRLESLYEEAIGMSPEARRRLLVDTSGTDPELAGELESLLRYADDAGAFLEAPALVQAARAMAAAGDLSAALEGRMLSHYRVERELRRGGMGRVYLGFDGVLQRRVALKALDFHLFANSDSKRRMLDEARATAALNHPNIGVVYEIEEDEGLVYIAMELIEGEALSERLKRERPSADEALAFTRQIAQGLAHAHSKGVLHRDLKPANVMLTESGAKIIDFGLAERFEPTKEGTAAPAAPSRERSEAFAGTPAYVSPEQARNEPLDPRSDIFSFGVVVYEMLSGRRPFRGRTRAEILDEVLTAEPAPAELSIPEARPILARCLAKRREERYPTMEALLEDLQRLEDERASSRQRNRAWRWVVAGTLLSSLVVGITFLRPRTPRTGSRPSLVSPLQLTSALGVEDYPSWSPHGGRLAYHATSGNSGELDIWLRWVDDPRDPINVTAMLPGDGRMPSWSPDGKLLAFWWQREGGRAALYLVPVEGGPPRELLEVTVNGASPPQWSAEGDRLAVAAESDTRLRIVSLEGEVLQTFELPGEQTKRFDLDWSPDERLVAYVDANAIADEVTRLRVLVLATGESVALTDGRSNVWSPAWFPDSRSLFYVSNQGGTMDLWRQAIDVDSGGVRPAGEPEPLSTGVGLRRVVMHPGGRRLAYTKGRRVANLWRLPVTQTDARPGWEAAEQLTFDQALIEFVDVSPDGERLVVSSDRTGNQDLWLLPASGGELQRLTSDPTPDWAPRWSPDGETIAFYSYRRGNRDIWTVLPTGESPRPLTLSDEEDYRVSWSPDGTRLAFDSTRAGSWDIWMMDRNGRNPLQLTEHPAVDSVATWSPDGNTIVFGSLRSGSYRLWQLSVTAPGPPRPLTEGPGRHPLYARDGRRIYFMGAEERQGDIWAYHLSDGSERPVTDLAGRRGTLGLDALAEDGEYLYFTWGEDLADVWVMELVPGSE